MVKKSKIFAGIMAVGLILQTAVFGACGGEDTTNRVDPPEDEVPPVETTQEVMPEFKYTTYDNTDLSNYSDGQTVSCEYLPNQFDENGIADPYVFRFNGMYYLYSTTQSSTPHMRAWKSRDMLHWEQCTGEGLQTGWVSNDSCLAHAYAPEVYYFNGKFYM